MAEGLARTATGDGRSASLNYLLTSHVWQQDHNGFSHQDPGFVDLVANKKADIVRIYFPPDANTLLCVADHCLPTYDRINVIVAGKQPATAMADDGRSARALRGGRRASGTGPATTGRCRAGRRYGLRGRCADARDRWRPCDLLRRALPELKVRVVNVVDLMSAAMPDRSSAWAGRRRLSTRCSRRTSR